MDLLSLMMFLQICSNILRIDYITTALKHLSNIIATLIQNRKIRLLG